jgi:predicted DCC family thiol-disulfide oxidoreductase YuxK
MRTQKDREVDAEFETAVRLAEYSSETSSRVLNEQFESTGPRSDSTVEIGRLLDQRISYLQAHRPVPKELQDRIDSLLDDSKRENEFWREESKSAEEAAAQAKKLFVEVRAELGMPPLKS